MVFGQQVSECLIGKLLQASTAVTGKQFNCPQCLRVKSDEFAGHREVGLVPTSSAIPAAAEKEQHKQDNDEKCCGIHVILPQGKLFVSTTGPSLKSSVSQCRPKPYELLEDVWKAAIRLVKKGKR